jgi:hypothetical protein
VGLPVRPIHISTPRAYLILRLSIEPLSISIRHQTDLSPMSEFVLFQVNVSRPTFGTLGIESIVDEVRRESEESPTLKANKSHVYFLSSRRSLIDVQVVQNASRRSVIGAVVPVTRTPHQEIVRPSSPIRWNVLEPISTVHIPRFLTCLANLLDVLGMFPSTVPTLPFAIATELVISDANSPLGSTS